MDDRVRRIKAALREMERIINSNPRLKAAANLGRACPACDGDAIDDRYAAGTRKCEACRYEWPM